jgi:hypothetical protein
MRHLLHRERPIGWLEGHTLGFFGFADTRDAANAAWVAYRTVSRKVASLLGTRPTPIDIEPLSIERRNGRDVIEASGRPFAQLIRPGPESMSGPDWFGFSIEVPPLVSQRALPGIMRAASHALLKSGLPWSMVRSRSRQLAYARQHAGPMASRATDRPAAHGRPRSVTEPQPALV